MCPNCIHLYYLLYRLQPAQVTVLAYCPAASQLPSGRFVGTPNDKNENIVQVSLTFNCISASGALGKRNRWRGWQILFSQILLFLEINLNTFRNSILLAAQCSVAHLLFGWQKFSEQVEAVLVLKKCLRRWRSRVRGLWEQGQHLQF